MEVTITKPNEDLIRLNAKYCIIYDVREDQDGKFVVCDAYDENNNVVSEGLCFYYDGEN